MRCRYSRRCNQRLEYPAPNIDRLMLSDIFALELKGLVFILQCKIRQCIECGGWLVGLIGMPIRPTKASL